MKVRSFLPLATAGCLLLVSSTACARDDSGAPTGIDVPDAQQSLLPQERPYYYYQGQRIELEVDPERMVVSSAEQSLVVAARGALRSIGVDLVDLGALPQAANHRLVRVTSRSGRASERAAALLRGDPRFEFVAPAFRTIEGRHEVLLLNRVDVQFNKGVTQAQVDSVNRELGTRILRLPRPDSGFFAYRLAYPSGPNVDHLAIARVLDRSPLVQWADPDKVSTSIRPSYAPSDPYYSSQFHLQNSQTLYGTRVDIDAQAAWDITKGNSSIKVAVIDDGVDFTNTDMGVIHLGYDLMYSPQRPSESAIAPCCNDVHGTAVAGIIAAKQDNGVGGSGVAPGVKLNSARIFRATYPPEYYSQYAVASENQIADAINWAWSTAGSDVLNNSWGGGPVSNAITSAIQNALTLGRGGRGTVVVFAAGNEAVRSNGDYGPQLYPSTLSSSTAVISVGAIDRFGTPANYTPDGVIDVVALSGFTTGVCVGAIVTTDKFGSPGCNDGPGGDINYTSSFSGTSAAAPQVSGVAALLLSIAPSLTAAQVKDRIRARAHGWCAIQTCGMGKLSAFNVVDPSW